MDAVGRRYHGIGGSGRARRAGLGPPTNHASSGILHCVVCSMMSVGPFLLPIQPLWQRLDQKELFNKIHGSLCADHGRCYTGSQLSSRAGVQRSDTAHI